MRAGLVVGSVTTSEYLVLYVVLSFCFGTESFPGAYNNNPTLLRPASHITPQSSNEPSLRPVLA
ncbi:hypothetical protein LX36DRAFT_165221, partial [Colletotrichum falcatum]